MEMRKVISCVLICSIFLAGCAGREANPIPVYMPGDENRSCSALQAEVAQLQADMQRLLPKTDKGLTNALWAAGGVFLIVPFFFMDFKDAEKIEFDAMRQRHNRLLVYAAEKECDFGEVRAERIPSAAERKELAKKAKKEKPDSGFWRTEEGTTNNDGRKIIGYTVEKLPNGKFKKTPVYEHSEP